MRTTLSGSNLRPLGGRTAVATPPTSSNPYSCGICGRTYGRLDHLSRHVRSHTKEKPFTCSVCSKAFTRADLLKRHETNHEIDAPNKRVKTSDPSRTRVAKACINCSESKLRCEGTYPCPRCEQKNLHCQYRSSAKGGDASQVANGSTEANGSNGEQMQDELNGDPNFIATHPMNGVQVPHVSNDNQTFGTMQSINGVQMPNVANDSQTFNAVNTTTLSPLHETRVPRPSIDHGPMENMLQHQTMQSQTLEPEPKQFSDQVNFENPYLFNNAPSAEDTGPTDPFAEPPGLANFLRDIMVPDLADGDETSAMQGSWDVLNFAVDTFGTLFEDAPNLQPLQTVHFEEPIRTESRSGHATPMGRTGMALSEQAWKTSPWHFVPAANDRQGSYQANLFIPMNDLVEQTVVANPLCPPIGAVSRDRVLATVLASCDASIVDRVVTCFPSAELLTNLMYRWLEFHQAQTSTWLHISSFYPDDESPEMLLNAIAAGATLSHIPQIRKLSLALLEAARTCNAKLFEKDNRNIRCLRPLQCTIIQLEATLWNGGRRLMEIAESFSQPIITMMRRGGRFQHSTSTPVIPDANDDELEVERKWHIWVEQESFKRLVYAVFDRDVQTSMSLLNPPLISCSELSLQLPLSRDLWDAKSSAIWRQAYSSKYTFINQVPSFKQYLESSLSTLMPRIIDLDLSLLVWLYGHWGLAWNYRQWSIVARHSLGGSGKDRGVVVSSLQQEIIKHLERYQIETFELDGMKPVTALTYQRVLMNMHSSLEDLQLLAGKSGQEEAKKVYSLLASWAQSQEARQAVYHAGQLLKAAKSFPIGMLQHSNAVACYHAGLVLWAFSVISKGIMRGSAAFAANQSHGDYVLVDGEMDARVQRFLVVGKGIPAICPYSAEGQPPQSHQAVNVYDTRGVVRVVVHLLRAKNLYREEQSPQLIENLSKLLRGLGRAAQSM